MNQPSLAPTNKVAAAGITGSASALIVWLLSLAHVDVPAEAAVAVSTVLSFIISWFVPNSDPPVLARKKGSKV